MTRWVRWRLSSPIWSLFKNNYSLRACLEAHQSVVPPGTEHAQALHALTRKYAEVAGLIGRAKAEVQRLTADLAHIKGTIQVLDPTNLKALGLRPRATA